MSNIDTIRGLKSVHRIKAIESTYEVRAVKQDIVYLRQKALLLQRNAVLTGDWSYYCSAARYPGPHSLSQGDSGKISLMLRAVYLRPANSAVMYELLICHRIFLKPYMPKEYGWKNI